jgi:hypothetical protein
MMPPPRIQSTLLQDWYGRGVIVPLRHDLIKHKFPWEVINLTNGKECGGQVYGRQNEL